MTEEVEKFLNLIRPYEGAYKSLDIRVIAYKVRDQWVNLATQITLKVSPPQKLKITDNLPKSTDLLVLQTIKPYCELRVVLEGLSQGRLDLEDKLISYNRPDSDRPAPFLRLACRTYARGQWTQYQGRDFKYTILTGDGESIGSIVADTDEFDCRLRSLEHPYDGSEDLARNFLSLNRSLNRHETTYIGVVAPSYLRFGEKCSTKNRKLFLEIESYYNVKRGALKLGIIEHVTERLQKRYSLKPGKFYTKPYKQKFSIVRKIGACLSVDVFLILNKDVVDRVKLYNLAHLLANPAIKMYHHFDPELKILSQNLQGKGNDPGKDFEKAIGLLLGLCGFLWYPYGMIPKIVDAVDGIALIPGTRKGLIYECTVDLPDGNNKLSKLSKRAKELSSLLKNYNLRPVIFTALTSTSIPATELRKAGVETISLATEENIEKLLNMFLEGREPSTIFNYVSRLIPSVH